MGNINFGRVILGGLVAGLVLNVGEFVLNDFILGAQMKSFFAAHNFAEPGTHFIVAAVGLTFVMGVVLVLGYACIRTRLGPGPKTAVIAGLFGWFGVYLYTGIINGLLFGIPPATMAVVVAFGLVEYALAAVAGAYLYKEA
jgi:hypothetical protein